MEPIDVSSPGKPLAQSTPIEVRNTPLKVNSLRKRVPTPMKVSNAPLKSTLKTATNVQQQQQNTECVAPGPSKCRFLRAPIKEVCKSKPLQSAHMREKLKKTKDNDMAQIHGKDPQKPIAQSMPHMPLKVNNIRKRIPTPMKVSNAPLKNTLKTATNIQRIKSAAATKTSAEVNTECVAPGPSKCRFLRAPIKEVCKSKPLQSAHMREKLKKTKDNDMAQIHGKDPQKPIAQSMPHTPLKVNNIRKRIPTPMKVSNAPLKNTLKTATNVQRIKSAAATKTSAEVNTECGAPGPSKSTFLREKSKPAHSGIPLPPKLKKMREKNLDIFHK